MILLHPILKTKGFGNNAPISLFVESKKSAETILSDLYGLIKTQFLSSSILRKEFEAELAKLEYELAAILYTKDKNSRSNLQFLQNICEIGTFQGEKFTALPVVFFSPVKCGTMADIT